MARKIYLSGKLGQGKFALVDDEDYDYLNQFNWHMDMGYAARTLRQHEAPEPMKVRMHADITGRLGADHRNRDRLDNRKENLLHVSQKENRRNSSKRKGTKYIGVSPKDGCYTACVACCYYGMYREERTAALVVDEVKRRLWVGSVYVENLPNERLPEGFLITNLDVMAAYQKSPKQSTTAGVVWIAARSRWRAKKDGSYRNFKTEQEAIDYINL